MRNPTFDAGATVLIRRPRAEGGPASAEVLAFDPSADGKELEIRWFYSGHKEIVSAAVVEPPCARAYGCITIRDTCRHCGEHFADPCLPGCPHGQTC
ncbi:hypothetical protein Ait01nite_020220 [Actinoplanes italicus]|uniref:Uncharacterized protein n=1 Tax=Actinoplanes italicus TaxID=113567 RepID=A0A2T0KPC5_9ACTN|nr:hypothetical protein [Actinoplanes italicus]PRX25579.1 hypothetical protein CLV67_101296 [Actinoplanes italicus]GIE28977.1 hypothetical protein Ait01nite_020220 [Actinoplanes italicus]